MGGKRKTRRTQHRIAAARPPVQTLIAQLRRRWKRTKGTERRARIAELVARGCSIRGLATDLHLPESTVRYNARSAPASAKPEMMNKIRIPAAMRQNNGRRIATPPSKQEQKPVSPARLREERPAPAGTGSQPSGLHDEHPAPPQGPAPVEENLASLRGRLPEIMVDFIVSKLGPPDSAAKAAIKELLGALRYAAKRNVPFVHPRHLPNPITMSQLFELSKPPELSSKERLNASDLGYWLAVLLVSLAPRPIAPPGSAWDAEIDQAEQRMFPASQTASTSPPDPRPQRRHVTFTTRGFSDRYSWMVPSRTKGF